ncbi:protein translocase subunit SecDF [Pseudalkalibacillus berkeleyi]|uniref:Multifunctional fusion protein n=1 Tax=Pseudalkalibacillus berkeleyi TaxID=1069813 RepID=A0ABS9H2K9_9BACL|nr:protein translocase subunit SecDF [Pseudalkalibacillus berkeleyi]MCF6138065.1 protein translocase subunit SecDF [Pseudalkalibacillus berkeleyi]
MVKRGRIVAFFLLVIMIAGTLGVTTKDIVQNIKLGLDLQGGFEVLYDVEPTSEGQEVDKDLLNNTVSALRERVDVLGVSEPNIQIEGKRIRVQLAGVKDQNKARELLSTQAELTFRDVNGKVYLKGSDLKEGGAKVEFLQNSNQPIVSLQLKDGDKFGQVTKQILEKKPNNRLVIWLDYEKGDSFQEEAKKENPKYISAPYVHKVINSKQATIDGMENVEEAQNLVDLLNAGSLPVKLKEIYSTSVGAKFGQDSLEKTVVAGTVGIALIFLFMLIFYRIPGIIAVITLSAYIYLILLVFDWMDGVLTLPGIAALILGVGMAVDANIITYERIKEELRSGKSVMSAFKAGNKRSLSTILDANITTILAAGVLFGFGTSSVKGFALVLIISILASFLTAVYGSRLLLGLWVNSRILNKKPRLFGVKQEQISDLDDTDRLDISKSKFKNMDFVKHRKKFFTISGVLIGLGVASLLIFNLNLGIDFASGSRIEITSDQSLNDEKIKEQLKSIDLESEEVIISGDKNNIAVTRYVGVLEQQEISKLKSFFKKEYGQEPNVSTVDPTVGRELAKNAMYAIAIASIGIIIYVTIRFEWLKALASIVALLHDAFFIIAIFSLLQIEVNLPFIAAVLTIVGYSINDTIVTFDRIRENSKYMKIKTFADLSKVVNVSLVQTLARSINTVLTVVFAAAALMIFGSEAIRNFSFALLIGLIAGTYSSLFIASQVWLVWKGKQLNKKPAKSVETTE